MLLTLDAHALLGLQYLVCVCVCVCVYVCVCVSVCLCVCSGGSRGDPGVRANPPLDPC